MCVTSQGLNREKALLGESKGSIEKPAQLSIAYQEAAQGREDRTKTPDPFSHPLAIRPLMG